MTGLARANFLALAAPAALILGALGSQYIGGLYPCEMCLWQRWPHYAAIVLAGLALAIPASRRLLVPLAAAAIAVSGVIGVFHAGVEYGWWEGLTTCSTPTGGSGGTLADIMAAPIVRCDEPQWTLGPISLAGFNALFSLAAAATIFGLLRRRA